MQIVVSLEALAILFNNLKVSEKNEGKKTIREIDIDINIGID